MCVNVIPFERVSDSLKLTVDFKNSFVMCMAFVYFKIVNTSMCERERERGDKKNRQELWVYEYDE